jgi:hypothetical protein
MAEPKNWNDLYQRPVVCPSVVDVQDVALFTIWDMVPRMNAAKTITPEEAVRRYLRYLEDPGSLRDEQEIQRKTKAVEAATDPIDKLKAITELERVSNIDEKPIRKGFVEHAKPWAEDAGVPASAFRELKVPDDVLREAGFTLPAGRGRGRSAGGQRQRARAVPIENIKGWIQNQKGTFLLADVMNGAGGSPATVRKAVDELIEAGQVKKLGPVPDYSGRGRAPLQYSPK